MTTTKQWNYANVWEEVAARYPERAAALHGDEVVTWGGFDRNADGLAATLLTAGLAHQSKVAQMQRNSAHYLEVMFACFKASLVPVNTNFRYLDDELLYVWQDSDAEAVVFDAEFTEVVSRVRDRLPAVRAWVRLGDDATCPEWAISYQDAIAREPVSGLRPRRSADDLMLLYTGGTTGKPKGVMWPQGDMFQALESAQSSDLTEVQDAKTFADLYADRPIVALTAAPLMHGTACWFAMPILARGGAIVTLVGRSLDPVELLDTVVRHRIKGICIAGNAFARPLLDALTVEPERWDLSGLRVITTSGAILAAENKQALLTFAPNAVIVDSLGSSESGSIGRSTSMAGSSSQQSSFTVSSNARVLDDNNKVVPRGKGNVGRLALSGHIPLGYYNEPERTAETFVTVDGRRYVVTGDLVEVDDDGTVTFLGRGSSCINTAGEKVYPEEVEEVIKTMPDVVDAAVIGVSDPRLGQAVTAIVALREGSTVDELAVVSWVKERLAGYKAPRRVYVTTSFPRGPNGKLDNAALHGIVDAAAASSV